MLRRETDQPRRSQREDDVVVRVLHGMQTRRPRYVVRSDAAPAKTEWTVERPHLVGR